MIAVSLLLALLASPASAGDRPDPELTPGVATELTAAEVCGKAWGKDVRHVTPAMKRQVFARYGMTGNTCEPDQHGRRCEIDHLIPRELGGADVVENLWPQPYGGKWNATLKDRLENRMHRAVCAGEIELVLAQQAIAIDWKALYVIVFGHPKE